MSKKLISYVGTVVDLKFCRPIYLGNNHRICKNDIKTCQNYERSNNSTSTNVSRLRKLLML